MGKQEGARGPLPVSRQPLLRSHVNAYADAIAWMVVGAGGVLLAGVLIGHVVRADRAIVAAVVTIAVVNRYRVTHGHRARSIWHALALALLIDLPAGHAAHHRTDRGGRVTRTAAADLAADRGADDAAEHGRHGRAGLRAGIAMVIAVLVVVAVVPVTVAAVAAVVVATVVVAAVVVAAVVGIVTVDDGIALVAPLRVRRGIARAVARIEHGIDAEHAGIVVTDVRGLRVVRRSTVGLRGSEAGGGRQAQGQGGNEQALHVGHSGRRDGVRGSWVCRGQYRLNPANFRKRIYLADSQVQTCKASAGAPRPSNGPTWLSEGAGSSSAFHAAASPRVSPGGTSSSCVDAMQSTGHAGRVASIPACAARTTAPDSSRQRRKANSTVAASESGSARRVEASRASRRQGTTSGQSRAGSAADQGNGGNGFTSTSASASSAHAIASSPPRLAPIRARGRGNAARAERACDR